MKGLNRSIKKDPSINFSLSLNALPQADFLHELGMRHIPMHYGAEELAEDLKAVESFAAR